MVRIHCCPRTHLIENDVAFDVDLDAILDEKLKTLVAIIVETAK